MSFFGKNIRKIRTAKKISQTVFAELFSLKRGSIGAYEEGRAEAKIETIIEIANYFKVSVDQLLCKELTFNDIYHIGEISKKYSEIVNPGFKLASAPLVTIADRQDFLYNLNNQDFLNERTKISLPELKAGCIAFEITESDFMTEMMISGKIKLLIGLPVRSGLNSLKKDALYLMITPEKFNIGSAFQENDVLKIVPVGYSTVPSISEKDNVLAVFEIDLVVSDGMGYNSELQNRLVRIEHKINHLVEKLS